MLVIAHRGAPVHAAENTLASFQKALDIGVEMIELDVYLLPSGELVVIHDNKVDRTTDGKGYVMDHSFDRLRDLDAGGGEKVPLLTEVLDVVNRRARVNIELKGEGTASAVAELINKYVTEKGWTNGDFFVSSFNHHELQRFKQLQPDVEIGALITGMPLDYAKFAEDMGAASVNPSIEFIDKAYVDDAHARGLKVYVFTVDEIDDFELLRGLGVDGVFSNHPDLLLGHEAKLK